MLGIPTAGAPTQPFLESLRQLVMPDEIEFERTIVTGNYIPAQRDLLLERAIEWNADVLVMCDDDMIVPNDALVRLLQALSDTPGAAAVGALYYTRDGLRPMAVDGWRSDDTAQGWIPAFDDRTPVAVDGVGTGCLAIRIAAARDLGRPFFPAQVYIERSEGRVRICNEDYLFCARLRAAGHQVLLHPGVRCGHYDRARNAVAPASWEDPAVTNRRRVLAKKGKAFELVVLEDAPSAIVQERHVPANVVYVETP